MMERSLSSIADKSSIRNEGRALFIKIADIPYMEGTWRDRLADAIARGEKSMREVSLAAGLGPGYVHSILKDGKDPTIEKLIAVCRAADVSLSGIVYGFDLSPEIEDLLALLAQSDPDDRAALLKLLRRKYDENQKQLPPPLQDQSTR